MKQADKIKELERRVRELEQAPRSYPVYVPYYVGPPVVVQPAPYYHPRYQQPYIWCGNYQGASHTVTQSGFAVTTDTVSLASAGYVQRGNQ